MRASVILTVPFAAAALAQSSSYENPFTAYLSETNSLGVVTGMPTVDTSQTAAVTTQPSVVTTQPSVATSPAGTPSYTPPAAYNTAAAVGSTGKNGTFVSGKLSASNSMKTSTKTKSSSETGTTTESSGSSSTGSSTSSSSTPKSDASLVEPFFGLSLAAGLFAYLL